MFAIEVEQLLKQFDGNPILRGLNLRIANGSVYGLVGPAGSGKTTLLLMLLGFLRPDRGRIQILNKPNLQQARHQIGYLPQNQRYHNHTTIREYLRFLGECHQIKSSQLNQRIGDVLESVGILDLIDLPLATLSPSQKQRFGLAQALLAEPELLILDAPSTGGEGLDASFLDLLSVLRQQNKTILIATQRIDEAEYLCDTIGVLANGQLVAEANTRALRGPGRNVLISVSELPLDLAIRLHNLSPAVQCEGAEIAISPNIPDLQVRVLQELLAANITIIAIEPFGRPIEELYLRAVRGLPLNPALPSNSATEPTTHRRITTNLNNLASEEAAPAPEQPATPGRSGTGDTLLRELLKHKDQ